MNPMPPTVRPPFWRHHGPALLGFLLLTALFTFPAVLRLTSHAAATGDVFAFVWELWWFHRAAFELHTSPLSTPLLFFPNPEMPLIWSTPVMLLPGMVLTGLLGPILAYNLLLLGGLALAGFGAYLLAHHVVGRRDAAFLAGVVFAFNPCHMIHVAVGQLGLASLQFVPFFALALLAFFASPTWKRAAALAAAAALLIATDLYVALYFLGPFLTVYFLYQWRTAPERLWSRPVWLRGGLAALTAGLAVAPFYWPTLTVLKGAATTVDQAESVHRYSQDLLQFLLPPATHLVLGALSRPIAPKLTNSDWGYLGWTVIALVAVALFRVRDRRKRFWGWFTLAAIVLSMGTYLHLAGPTPIPMPYLIATKLPLLQNFRAPGRFMMFAALGLGLLAAFGLKWLLERRTARQARVLVAAVLALVTFEYLVYFPYPTRSASVPAFYHALAKDPTAGAILELPTGDTSWGGIDHQWMYHQTVHRRPLVYAHTHRVPDGMLSVIQGSPVLSALTQLARTGGRLQLAPEHREGARTHLAEQGITHVVLHPLPGMLEGPRYETLKADLAGMFGAPELDQPDMAVFRLDRPAQDPASSRR